MFSRIPKQKINNLKKKKKKQRRKNQCKSMQTYYKQQKYVQTILIDYANNAD